MTKESLELHYFVGFFWCFDFLSEKDGQECPDFCHGLRVASWVLNRQQSAVAFGSSVVLQLAPGLKCVCVKLIEALFSCYRSGLLLTGDSSHWSVRGSTGGWGCSLWGDGETKPHQHLITGATQRCPYNKWVGKEWSQPFQKLKLNLHLYARLFVWLISVMITLCHKISDLKYLWQINWPSWTSN